MGDDTWTELQYYKFYFLITYIMRKQTKWRLIILWLICLSSLWTKVFAQTNNQSYATRIRNTSLISSNPDTVVENLVSNSINEVYLQIDQTISSKTYQSFIKQCLNKDIHIYALDGSANRTLDKNAAKSLINWVATYNKKNPKYSFEGIHLDVEPYLLSWWESNQAKTILAYQTVVTTTKNLASKKWLTLTMDIPFWFDEITYKNKFGRWNLGKWIIKKTDWIAIMAYRDTANAILPLIKNEYMYAKKYKKTLIIWLETNPSSEWENVTFYEECVTILHQEINTLLDTYWGLHIALHDYEGIRNLRK